MQTDLNNITTKPMKNKKQTALDWYWDKTKSHFQHDGDFFETACFTFAIAKQKEEHQMMDLQSEISDEEIEKWVASTPYYGHCTPEYKEGLEDGIKWYKEQLKSRV